MASYYEWNASIACAIFSAIMVLSFIVPAIYYEVDNARVHDVTGYIMNTTCNYAGNYRRSLLNSRGSRTECISACWYIYSYVVDNIIYYANKDCICCHKSSFPVGKPLQVHAYNNGNLADMDTINLRTTFWIVVCVFFCIMICALSRNHALKARYAPKVPETNSKGRNMASVV
jgi:hypothetical protein